MSQGLLFFEPFKIILVAILIYVIIFMLLKKTNILGSNSKANSLVALISAILVAFSGAITYALSYMLSWFIIILIFLFCIFLLFLFIGGKSDVFVKSLSNPKNAKIILILFAILFLGIFFKSFFALNNSFSSNNSLNQTTNVNTSTNFGIKTNGIANFFGSFFSDLENSTLTGPVLFLLIIAGIVFFMK